MQPFLILKLQFQVIDLKIMIYIQIDSFIVSTCWVLLFKYI